MSRTAKEGEETDRSERSPNPIFLIPLNPASLPLPGWAHAAAEEALRNWSIWAPGSVTPLGNTDNLIYSSLSLLLQNSKLANFSLHFHSESQNQ